MRSCNFFLGLRQARKIFIISYPLIQSTSTYQSSSTAMSSNAEEVPQGNTRNDEYVSRQGAKNESVPVQSDQDTVQDPIDPNTADTDAQLGQYFQGPTAPVRLG